MHAPSPWTKGSQPARQSTASMQEMKSIRQDLQGAVHVSSDACMQVIETVLQYGGAVMRFAGDSIICCFSPTADEATAQDRGLAAATLRCVRCTADLAANLSAPLDSDMLLGSGLHRRLAWMVLLSNNLSPDLRALHVLGNIQLPGCPML